MIDQKYLDRFNKKYVIQDSGCWHWTGWKNHNGYGFLRFLNKKEIQAHRFSAKYLGGLDIDNKVVCHHCDNPSCVNPDHLFTGSQKDNIDDAIKKGRHHVLNPSIRIRTPLGIFSSQNAAARAHNVDPTTIRNWLKNKPDQYQRLR